MFTGIVQTVGTVISATRKDGDLRLLVDAPDFNNETIELGDSIAVNGVCLTVIERSESQLSFDVSLESISRTLIGDWKANSKVNLELALLPTTRLGGHLVSGHVDGLGELVSLKQDARSWRMQFRVPKELQHYIAEKGSVTIDGISLTVNGLQGDLFDINVVPHTMQVTTMGTLSSGDKVHLEVDLIARYLERLLLGREKDGVDISVDFLEKHGFTK